MKNQPSSGPTTGYWLQHFADNKRSGHYRLVHVAKEARCLLHTGSGVLMLKLLRKLKLQTPDIMGLSKGFTTDWTVRW